MDIEVANGVSYDFRWYAVRTKSGAENLASSHLQRQSFDIFLPKRIRTVRHARRISTIKDAYFPGYLFVSLCLDRDRWRCVNSTVGVSHLLCAGGRPLPIRKGIIEELLSATDSEGILQPERILTQGQKVRIAWGAFAERVAVVHKLKNSDVVCVLMSMMDREVTATIPVKHVYTLRDQIHL